MNKYNIQHPGFLILTLFSLTILLVLTGFFIAITYSTQRYANKFQEEVKLIVELKTGATDADSAEVTKAVKSAEGVLPASVEFISKEAALEEMRKEMSGDILLEEMENPFSDMIRFSVDAAHFNEQSIAVLKQNIESLEPVHEMHYPAGMYDPVFSLLKKVQAIGAAVIFVFVLLCAILIHHLMRMNILAQRKQIRTMQLVGGHPSFIRKPYLLRAFQMGLMAWAIAGIICLSVLLFFAGMVQTELSPADMTIGAAILLVLALAVCLGSTWVAVTRVLNAA